MTRRTEIALAAVVALVLFPAPTVGDVGGCGKTATVLDPALFQRARKVVDCDHCRTCGLATVRCARACNLALPSDVEIPATCHPLYHDGEVCIRALEAASCTDYAAFMDDAAPTIPSECEFCRVAPDGGAP